MRDLFKQGGATAIIFANQIYRNHPALEGADRVLLVESRARLGKRPYHAQKLIYILSSLRHYAKELRSAGYTVDYRRAATFDEAIRAHIADYAPKQLLVLEPPEYAPLQTVLGWEAKYGVPLKLIPDTVGFTCPRRVFLEWGSKQKSLLMERFYRWQRERLNILMDGDQPVNGRWNYDEDNREEADTLPTAVPNVPVIAPDAITQEVITYVQAEFPQAFGQAEPFHYPVTYAQAEQWLAQFISDRLSSFGPWEDAMRYGEPYLFHGVMALLLNNGLLTPRQVVDAVEAAYREGAVPIQSAEGFIRQIIGWREYVHGVYWLKMPEYADRNFFDHYAPLPEFFWSGETNMRCMRDVITTVQQHAYSHHIPRLMVIANFGNLAGLDPQALTEWFQTVYIDAYDWVMQPNVIGLALYADGGMMATKPYIASAAYINKMSDGYCPQCFYDRSKRTGERACPFNTLYWDFLARHADKLARNPRIAVMVKSALQRPDLVEIQVQAARLKADFASGQREVVPDDSSVLVTPKAKRRVVRRNEGGLA